VVGTEQVEWGTMAHKLLLADDSVTIQRVIELTFADEDVLLTAVGDGRLAIEKIVADPPDIVLADVGMPEKDGYEVAAFIKNDPRFSHIPVLLLTGAFEPVDEERARAVGCDGVLAKPFEPQMVITRVKELLAEASRPSFRAPFAHAADATGGNDAPFDVFPDAGGLGEEAPAQDLTEDVAVRIQRRPGLAVSDLGATEEHPLVSTEPALAAPVPAPAIDDYFERLDSAFANLSQAPAVPPQAPLTLPWTQSAQDTDAPFDFSSLVGGAQPDSSLEPEAAQPAFAQAFSALLAAERGEEAEEANVPPALPITPAPPASDDLVARVTREVLGQMSERIVRETVTDIVSRVAERLVREEIDRIKASIK